MTTVREILATKGTNVLSVGPDATVLDAALLMNEHKIGSLVVMEGRSVCGIITERDILRRIVVPRLDPSTTAVRDVMTTEVVCCELGTSAEEAKGVMKNRRIRHLPVCNERREVCGLISIGDLNSHDASNHERTIHLLQEYIQGHPV